MRAVDCSVHEAVLAYAIAALSAESVVRTVHVHAADVARSSFLRTLSRYEAEQSEKYNRQMSGHCDVTGTEPTEIWIHWNRLERPEARSVTRARTNVLKYFDLKAR